MFGKDYFYLLDKKNNIDFESLRIFLNKYKNEKILIFGFTEKYLKFFIKKIYFIIKIFHLKILFFYMVVDGKNLKNLRFPTLNSKKK